ncbi:class I SAM-dependent methyltransferase [Adhaeretor mobilis]|uniref:Ribosomal RNA large subunit methyltransferase K n=1 Tax=Adhaeretor mobilis TaxID=1930276 RepID=A0A517MR75_9BACT|nr:class I SAM-dependent methyltransferase [Adhaeretor mobilis]QDS97297.1 Ribosomal RNA large subunit methyltransferase K [Adhaeretor mobilis]
MIQPTIHDYELLDFGEGRKLEQFGPWVLDRPCPAAVRARQSPDLWKRVTARFEGDRAADGRWKPSHKKWVAQEIELPITIDNAHAFRMKLTGLPSGQVGIFPEQVSNWQWIAKQIARAGSQSGLGELPAVKVLNLFAYTGGSTLAAAVAGAEVTHVDAAKSMVARARKNAEISGLAEHPVRWIVEDAVKFCQREVKRGNQYDAVILDPPSYGHGPKGEAWSISRDLLPLLKLVGELTSDRRAFILTTCHTPNIGPAELEAMLAEGIFGQCGQGGKTGNLFLESAQGKKLPSGVFARWPN